MRKLILLVPGGGFPSPLQHRANSLRQAFRCRVLLQSKWGMRMSSYGYFKKIITRC